MCSINSHIGVAGISTRWFYQCWTGVDQEGELAVVREPDPAAGKMRNLDRSRASGPAHWDATVLHWLTC